jgi:hypothetical protein
MEYFVYLPDVGMQVFQNEEEVQMERLADVGLRRRRRGTI